MKNISKKSLFWSLVFIAMVFVFSSISIPAFAQNAKPGFAPGTGSSSTGSGSLLGNAGSNPVVQKWLNEMGLGGSHILPAPKTSGKWQLKYDQPGIHVGLLGWNCRDKPFWEENERNITKFINNYHNETIDTQEVAADSIFSDHANNVEKEFNKGMKSSPSYGVFTPPFGGQETKTVKYCYTDDEKKQIIAYWKAVYEHLSDQSDPIGEIRKMFS